MEPVWQELAESATQENLLSRFADRLRRETGLSFQEGLEGASEGVKELPRAAMQTAAINPMEKLQGLLGLAKAPLGLLGMAFSPVKGAGQAIAQTPVEEQWGSTAEKAGVAAGLLPDIATLGKLPLMAARKGAPIIEKILRGLRTSKVPKVTGAKTIKPSIGESETGLSQYIPEEVSKRQIPNNVVRAVGGKGEPAGAWEGPGGIHETDWPAYKQAMQEATERQVVEAWKAMPESLKRRILGDPKKLLTKIEGLPAPQSGAQIDILENTLTQWFGPPGGGGANWTNILHELIHHGGKFSDPASKGTSFPRAAKTIPGLQYRKMLEEGRPDLYGSAARSAEEIGPVMADRLLPVTDKGWQHRRNAAWETVKPKSFREGYEADLQDLWPEEAKRVFKQIQSSRKRQAMKETVPHQ